MIKITNLCRNWGNFSISGVNLEVKTGEFFGLFGHNGAGKTLLLETIAGIWYPDKGEIFIDSKNMTLLPPEKRNIGFVYQEPWFFPHLSVKENICFGLRVRKRKKKEIERRIEELNVILKLDSVLMRKNTGLLSGGEKQKVSLARVLATNPGIIFCDEPTHSLDRQARESFYKILSDIRKNFATVIVFVSHDYEELKDLADRIGIMEEGRLVQVDGITPRF